MYVKRSSIQKRERGKGVNVPNDISRPASTSNPPRGLTVAWWSKREIVGGVSVSVPYTFKKRELQNGVWKEVDTARSTLLPVDLAVKIARAALRDADGVLAIEERIRTFAQQAPIISGEKPHLDQELLDSVEAEIDKILNRHEQKEKRMEKEK